MRVGRHRYDGNDRVPNLFFKIGGCQDALSAPMCRLLTAKNSRRWVGIMPEPQHAARKGFPTRLTDKRVSGSAFDQIETLRHSGFRWLRRPDVDYQDGYIDAGQCTRANG